MALSTLTSTKSPCYTSIKELTVLVWLTVLSLRYRAKLEGSGAVGGV